MSLRLERRIRLMERIEILTVVSVTHMNKDWLGVPEGTSVNV